jgi:hypothetical protein
LVIFFDMSKKGSSGLKLSTKAEVAASIEAAKVELEQALAHLTQLPALDWGSVRRGAHTLGNYLNINNACVQLLQMSLADYPDQEVKMWLQSLDRTTELMTYIARHLTNASTESTVPLSPEKDDSPDNRAQHGSKRDREDCGPKERLDVAHGPSLFAENQINHPASLRMQLLFAKVLSQLGVARFEQGIVKGEGAVLAVVERFSELHDGGRP